MELKESTTVVIIIVAIGLILGIGLFVLGQFQTTVFVDSTDTSTTQTVLSSSTATLTPVDTGITSSEVKANNKVYLDFDGVDDYVSYGDKDAFSPVDNNNVSTFSIWFKMNTNNFTGNVGKMFIISKGDTSNYEYDFHCLNATSGSTSNKCIMNLWRNDGGASNTVYFDNNYTLNKWHNAIIVLNNSEFRLFVDGIYNDYDPITAVNKSGTTTLRLGQRQFVGWLNGSLDDFRIYNKTLTQAQSIGVYQDNNKNDGNIFIPVGMYHSIAEATTTYINSSTFREQLEYLNSSGYETITDIEYYNWTQDGGFQMPEKPIMFVFDDATLTALTVSAPIMDEFGYKGIIALITDSVNTTGSYLTWENVSSLINDYDWSVASHSHNHCSFTGEQPASGTYNNCTTPETRISNFSVSKELIIGNLSFTPITFIYPYNFWNSTTMNECKDNYTLCFGYSGSNPYTNAVAFVHKSTNFSNGELVRMSLGNSATTMEKFDSLLNRTLSNDFIINSGLNENSGTTAHDSSGNSNDGTISGATWTTDGVLKTLTAITDYTIDTTTGLFTIVNTDYAWSELLVSYDYTAISDSTGYNSMGTMRSGLATFADWIALIVIVFAAAIVLGIIISSFGGGRNRI